VPPSRRQPRRRASGGGCDAVAAAEAWSAAAGSKAAGRRLFLLASTRSLVVCPVLRPATSTSPRTCGCRARLPPCHLRRRDAPSRVAPRPVRYLARRRRRACRRACRGRRQRVQGRRVGRAEGQAELRVDPPRPTTSPLRPSSRGRQSMRGGGPSQTRCARRRAARRTRRRGGCDPRPAPPDWPRGRRVCSAVSRRGVWQAAPLPAQAARPLR